MSDETANRPARYQKGGLDVIDFVYAECREAGHAFCRGSIYKYLRRMDDKGVPLEQLKKARVFLDRMIEQEEKCTEQKS